MSTNNDAQQRSTSQPPPSSQSASTIRLKIKVPAGHLPTSANSSDSSSFDLGAVPLNSTIGALRQLIQTIIPSNPAPERQRLLYGGRALVENDQSVQDALNTRRDPQQGEYVVHLLVKGEGVGSGRSLTPTPAVGVRHGRAGSAPPPGTAATGQQQQGVGQQQPQGGAQPVNAPPMMPIPPHLHGPFPIPPAFQQHMQMAQAQAQRTWGMPAPQIPPGFPPPGPMRVPGAPAPTLEQLQARTNAHGSNRNQNGPMAPQTQQPDSNDSRTQVNAGTASAPPTEGAHQQHIGQQQSQQQSQQQQHQHHAGPWSGTYRIETVGPNGERSVQHHHVGSLNLPFPGAGPGPAAFPHGQPAPFHSPWAGMPQQIPFQMPGMPSRQQNTPGQAPGSALDRARENMREMRRMLEEVRNQASEDQGRRIRDVQERARQLEGYIDPFNVAARGNASNATASGNNTANNPTNAAGTAANGTPGSGIRTGNRRLLPSERLQLQARQIPDLGPPAMMPQQQTVPNPNNVSAYLLSSPEGPQALIFDPQFGIYAGTTTLSGNANTQPAPTRTQQQTQPHAPPGNANANANAAPDPLAQAIHLAAGRQAHEAAVQANLDAGRGPAGQDPLAPLQPLLQHFWLLLRILIFAYFLLGGSLGYTRPLILVGIGIAFWAVRMGALGEGLERQVRAWWEGVVGVPARRDGQRADGAQAPAQGQPNAGAPNAPPPEGERNQQAPPAQQQGQQQQRMPTPEQVAQRLLHENQDQRRGWLREQIRPVERAVALFVASLWPGIGEAHVRAQREEEQRRLAEEEVEARRRAAEQARMQEAEGEKKVEGAGSVESEKKEGVDSGEGSKRTEEKTEGEKAVTEGQEGV